MQNIIQQIINFILDQLENIFIFLKLDSFVNFLRIKIVRVFLIWLGKQLVLLIKKWQFTHFQLFYELYSSEIFQKNISLEVWMMKLPFVLWTINEIIFISICILIVIYIYFIFFKIIKYCFFNAIESMRLFYISFYFLIKLFSKKLYKKFKEIFKK